MKLEGASGTTTYLQLAYNGATNAQSGYIGYNSSSQMQFFTNDTLRATLDASGNLGLGVTPSQQLTVGGRATIQLSLVASNNTGASEIYFGDSDAVFRGYIGYQHNGDYFQFSTAASEKMRLNASGNLSVGNTNDTYKLDVSGTGRFVYNGIDTRFGGASSFVLNSQKSGLSSGQSVAYLMGLENSLNNQMTMLFNYAGYGSTSNYLGLGFYGQDNLFKLYATGAATFSSSVTAGSSVTATGGFYIPNGTYYYAKRSTGGADINVLGFASGSDTLTIKGGSSGGTNSINFEDTGGIIASFYNGRLGIGTTSPGAKLHVLNSSVGGSYYGQLIVEQNGEAAINIKGVSYSSIYFGDAANQLEGGIVYNHITNTLDFRRSGNVNALTLGPSGAATFSSTVEALRYNATSSNASLPAYATATGTGMFNLGSDLGFSTSSTERMRITSGGNVLIGETSNASGSPTFYVKNKAGAVANIAGWNFGGTTTADNGNNNLLTSGAYYNGSSMVATQTTATGYQQYSGIHVFYTNSGLTPGNAYSNTERMRITNDGQVGIGTATPSIYGLTFANQFTVSSTTTYANITVAGSSGNSGGIDFGSQTVRHAGVYGLNGSDLGFYTNGSNSGNGLNERMRITSGGDVGIGTSTINWSTANRKVLELNGTSTALLGFKISDVGKAYLYHTGADLIITNLAAAGGYLALENNGSERMRITSGGSVGIGTTSPATKLSLGGYNGARLPYINGTGNTFDANGITVPSSNNANSAIGGGIDLTNNTYSVGAYSPIISFSSLGVNSAYNNSYAGIWGVYQGVGGDSNWGKGDLAFGTALAFGINERMRITSAGIVGIGTASPSSYYSNQLVVYAGSENGITIANSGTSGSQYLMFADGTSGADRYRGYIEYAHTGDYMVLATASTERMRITSDGNVGIGTSSPISKLTVDNTTNNIWLSINNARNSGSSPTYGLSITTSHASSSLNDVNHYGAYIVPNFTTSSSNLGTVYGAFIQPTESGVYNIGYGYGLYVQALTVNSGTISNNYAAVFMGGNVGIGTSTPSSKLEVFTGGGYLTVSTNDGAGSYDGFGLNFRIANSSQDLVQFRGVYTDSGSGGSGGLNILTKSARYLI